MTPYNYHPIYKYLIIGLIFWIIYNSNIYLPKSQITGLTIASILVVFVVDNIFIKGHEEIFEFDVKTDAEIIEADVDKIVADIEEDSGDDDDDK